jgi:acetyl-CoA acyltransferase
MAASTTPDKPDTQTPLGGDERIAIVDGARTPFAKAWTVFKDWNEADLGRVAVRKIVERTEIDPGLVDDVVIG